MRHDDRKRGPRPVPVTEAVRDLIRKTAADRPGDAASAPSRSFLADHVEWTATIAGEGNGGTGSLAPACLVAVRFFRADDPDRPRRETLLARGRFEHLYDHELAALLHAARRLEPDADRA